MYRTRRPHAGLSCLLAVGSLLVACQDPPDLHMTRLVTKKTIDLLREHYDHNYEQFTQGPGTVITSTNIPPRGEPQSLMATVKTYQADQAGWDYTVDAEFSHFAGDGSRPYMELTGSVTFADDSYPATPQTLKGKLQVARTAEDITIDTIEYDLSVDSNGDATGTVIADGVTFQWRGQSLNWD